MDECPTLSSQFEFLYPGVDYCLENTCGGGGSGFSGASSSLYLLLESHLSNQKVRITLTRVECQLSGQCDDTISFVHLPEKDKEEWLQWMEKFCRTNRDHPSIHWRWE